MSKVQTLSHSLKQQWDSFEKQFQLTRENTSPNNVHALRVVTRRLEATLVMANYLKFTRKSQKILSMIKKVRKSLGPLRDIQVEELALKELHFNEMDRKKGKTFRTFLSRNKEDAKKKARQCLKQIALKKKRKSLLQLEKKLQAFESKKDRGQIEKRLKEKIKSNILRLNRTVSDQGPMKVEKIHRIRLLIKKCRYQCEGMKSLTDDSIVDLSKLRQLQTVTGKIQNDKILIQTLDRFLDKKKNHDNLPALALRKKVCAIQSQLMKPKRVR